MPVGIGVGTAIAIGSGVGGTVAGVYAANKSSGAAKESAKLQTDAANHAADLQTQAAKDALDFQKQQAAQDLVTHNATAKANYDQWAAREARISSLGSSLGLAPRNIPAFVPTPGPTDTPAPGATPAGATPTGATPTGATPAVPPPNASPEDVGHFVANFFASKGVQPNPTSVEYWTQKWAQFGQKDPAYFMQRLASADEFGGQAGAGPSASQVPSNLTQAARFQPTVTGPYTPALQAPQIGTLASYARRA